MQWKLLESTLQEPVVFSSWQLMPQVENVFDGDLTTPWFFWTKTVKVCS